MAVSKMAEVLCGFLRKIPFFFGRKREFAPVPEETQRKTADW
jgi:hypothetical protein